MRQTWSATTVTWTPIPITSLHFATVKVRFIRTHRVSLPSTTSDSLSGHEVISFPWSLDTPPWSDGTNDQLPVGRSSTRCADYSASISDRMLGVMRGVGRLKLRRATNVCSRHRLGTRQPSRSLSVELKHLYITARARRRSAYP